MHDNDSAARSTLLMVDRIAVASCLACAFAAAALVLLGLVCL